MDHAIKVVTFLLRDNRGAVPDEERRGYRHSLEAISGLLTKHENKLRRGLAELAPEAIVPAVQQTLREAVNLTVSNSPECLGLLKRTGSDKSGRRMLVTLSESPRMAVVISIIGEGSLNFKLRQPAENFDLSGGFELEFDGGRILSVTRDRCQAGPGCDVSVIMKAPEAWESELLVELASAEIRRIWSLANPKVSIPVGLSAASKVRRAFVCVVDR